MKKLIFLLYALTACNTPQFNSSAARMVSAEGRVMPQTILGTWCMVNGLSRQGHTMTFTNKEEYSGKKIISKTYLYDSENFTNPAIGEYVLNYEDGEARIAVIYSGGAGASLSVESTVSNDRMIFGGTEYSRCSSNHDFSKGCDNGKNKMLSPMLSRNGKVCIGDNIWM